MSLILKNLPNILTILRIILSPVFVVLFVKGLLNSNLLLINISYLFLLIASVTDILDGYLARKYKIVSNFGKIYDPLADKILIFSSFWLMLFIFSILIAGFDLGFGATSTRFHKLIIGFYCLLICASILRDMIITIVRFKLKRIGVLMHADRYGKLKTFFQIITVHSFFLSIIILFSLKINTVPTFLFFFSYLCLIISFFFSIASAFNYIKQYRIKTK